MADDPVLVIGAGGQLGTAFCRIVGNAVGVTRGELDLATASADEIFRLFDDVQPSVVINCAAYTAVDRAESEEELATEVNGHAVERLAAAAFRFGASFVTYSTDYVFDGKGQRPYLESHPTDPINAYGRSKLVGEHAALSIMPDALVVRTSWVLSATHRNFVTAILGRAVEGKALRVVDDQVGCPTVADDLAVGSLEALRAGASGLLHLTNRGETTWYRLAQVAVDKGGMDMSLVAPCTTEEYPTPAQRPSYSVLGSEVTGSLGLDPLPDWRESIDRVVAGSLGLIGG